MTTDTFCQKLTVSRVMVRIKKKKVLFSAPLLSLLVRAPRGRLLFVSSCPDAQSCNKIQLLRPHEVSVIGQCLVNEQHTPQITAGNWNKRTGPAAAAAASTLDRCYRPKCFGPRPLIQTAGMGAADGRTIGKEREDEEGNRVSNHRLQQLESRIEMSRHDERLKVTGLHLRKCPNLLEGCFFISIIYSRRIARAYLTLCLQPSAK